MVDRTLVERYQAVDTAAVVFAEALVRVVPATPDRTVAMRMLAEIRGVCRAAILAEAAEVSARLTMSPPEETH